MISAATSQIGKKRTQWISDPDFHKIKDRASSYRRGLFMWQGYRLALF